ncbi:GNAT family N-acetyltransferase [Salinarimonas soli]|uniref:GNAT family N-acetyltransferase n=1 Tax=Salinarimonas soli TaxID=1638099 RepID=A0A5B2VG62_9HYPH|nr:GNAT family N-acetyltransferase [Salinarimonas soli]KAA2237319.1 GNAT family N-acetyltransferase [Salinarimonas soli]
MDHTLIAALESRLVNAWPAFEVAVAEGWLLRFASGYSKRANSASPLVPGADLDDGLIDHIVRRFERQGIVPTFRLTGLEAPGVEAKLAARGLVDFEPTLCMMAPLAGGEEPEPAVQLERAASPAWIRNAAEAYGGDKADRDILGVIVGRIRESAAFATLVLDDRPVAWGLGVTERGFTGLYDIVVAPDLRGLGLGRQVVRSLMTWGREHGATHAYLQVREANEVARSLYGSLGFADAYRYTHRIPPPPV